MAKVIYNGKTGEILGVHILGLHAADLIHEASNAIALGQTVQQLKFAVHAHPTLAEVIDEVFKARRRAAAALREGGPGGSALPFVCFFSSARSEAWVRSE